MNPIRPTARMALITLALATTWSVSGASDVGAPSTGVEDPETVAQAETLTTKEAWREARRLSDGGLYEAALVVINQALDRDPDSVDLLWLRAGVTGWDGRPEEAVRLYVDLIARHPELSESVRLDLAHERYKAGALSAAVRDLDRYLAQHPENREARRLRDLAMSGNEPGMTVTRHLSDDSDDMRQISETLEYYHPVGFQDVMLILLRREQRRRPSEASSVRMGGIGHERSWSRRWSSYVSASVLDTGDGHTRRGLVDAGLAWKPRRGLRLDVSAERRPQLKPKALELGIMSWTVGMSVDLEVHPRMGLGLSRREYYYSDDNRSVRNSVSTTLSVLRRDRVRAWLSFNVQQFKSEQELPHGYYDPRHYIEFGPELEIELDPPGAWTVNLHGNIGRQSQDHADPEPLAGLSARVQIPVTRFFNLGVEVFRSDSNIATDGGFERRGWNADLNTHF